MSAPINGITITPAIQISPYGSAITLLKAYPFTLTDAQTISSTFTTTAERTYTVTGLSTDDFPFALVPSTGNLAGGNLAVASMSVSAANTLKISWARTGTTTGAIAAQVCNVFTLAYYNAATSTTT